MPAPLQSSPEAAPAPVAPTEGTGSAPSSPQPDGSSFIPKVVRNRTMSILQADMPRGMSGLTGMAAGRAPTLVEVRQGAYTTDGEERRQQFSTDDSISALRGRNPSVAQAKGGSESVQSPRISADHGRSSLVINARNDDTVGTVPNTTKPEDFATSIERVPTATEEFDKNLKANALVSHPTIYDLERTSSGTFPNGYKFPPKHTWKEATAIGFWAFLNFTFRSWTGFLIVFYCVQVIGWGGMIFLLLCTAADTRMCWLEKPRGSGYWVKDCSDKHTSKSLWIEIDAQVLTALFCVTAFGLAPWRCRDLWHLMQYRIWHEHLALRKLAAAHKGWFRLPGSQHLDPAIKATDLVEGQDDDALKLVPHPSAKAPAPPLTAVRALPTKVWKMDFVVWMMFGNTIFQVILCGFMWGQNRYVRPAWATALFIVLGMLSGMAAGWVQFAESKKIKQREGIPLKASAAQNDSEQGSVKEEKRRG